MLRQGTQGLREPKGDALKSGSWPPRLWHASEELQKDLVYCSVSMRHLCMMTTEKEVEFLFRTKRSCWPLNESCLWVNGIIGSHVNNGYRFDYHSCS